MKELIRDVNIDGHRLRLYDTGLTDTLGKCRLEYDFTLPGEKEPLFSGDHFCCSPLHAIDSDECVRALLGFLTLRRGDTDPEYFEEYNEKQLEWSDSNECEMLAAYAHVEEGSELVEPFEEWRENNTDAID